MSLNCKHLFFKIWYETIGISLMFSFVSGHQIADVANKKLYLYTYRMEKNYGIPYDIYTQYNVQNNEGTYLIILY